MLHRLGWQTMAGHVAEMATVMAMAVMAATAVTAAIIVRGAVTHSATKPDRFFWTGSLANFTGIIAALVLLATSYDAMLRKLGTPGWNSFSSGTMFHLR